MALTAGALSQVSVDSNSAKLASAAAASGTAPYTYAWYRSTTTGFTPGSGNIVAGLSGLSVTDSGLIPGTNYFYKVIVTDSAATPATATATQLSVTTLVPSQNQNQFAQQSFLGMLDLRFNFDTIAAEIDVSQSGGLYAGMPVKIVDSAGGVPKVVGISATTDEVFGYINYDVKTALYVAGTKCEISQAGNVMYLYSAAAISRGVRVSPNIVMPGSVQVGATGDDIVGFTMDKATASGQLIRVKLMCPSFHTAS